MKRIIPLVAAALVGAGAYYFFVYSPSQVEVAQSSEAAVEAETMPQDTAQDTAQDIGQEGSIDISVIPDMQLGDPDAPVTVIEYASFTCPHCASFHASSFKKLKKNYIDTGKVNFIYREVYFDRYGLWASMIARCAGSEKFFGIADLIYTGQSQWTGAGEPALIIDGLRKIGRLAGIDETTLEACLADEEKAKTLVEWYKVRAGADGIDSTPSFVINGTKYTNMSYTDFSTILDEAAE